MCKSSNNSIEITKIQSPFVHIIVEGTKDKPYYRILYYDSADESFHIGYSSYSLDQVFRYMDDYFDIPNCNKII